MFEASKRPAARSLRIIAVALAFATLAPATHASQATAGAWHWPVTGTIITPFRNVDNPYAGGQHRGIDIAAAEGTEVASTTNGSVSYAGRLPDGGNCVTVRTADGRFLVSYLHLAAIAVARGHTIAAGEALGVVGTTGRRSAKAPHLHLSVRLVAGGDYVDPLPLLGAPPSTQPSSPESTTTAAPEQAVPPTAAVQPKRHAAKPRSHKRSRTTSGRRSGGRSAVRSPRVHAHNPGDIVAPAPTSAGVDSARESHASRGRVAPPPLSSASRPLSGRDRADRHPMRSRATISARPIAGRRSSFAHVWRPALATIVFALAAVWLALRGRGEARPGGTAPRPQVVLADGRADESRPTAADGDFATDLPRPLLRVVDG